MDLFVGEPVKNRETSEPKDSEALTPHIISAMPTASSATETPLYMCPLDARRSKRLPTADDAHQDHDDGDDEENVDEPVDRVRGNEAQQPQENHDDCDRV